MPGLLAAAPYERRMDVMKQKRQAHAGVIAASKRRGEHGSNLASAATGDVSTGDGQPRQQEQDAGGSDSEGGGSDGKGEEGEQRGAA